MPSDTIDFDAIRFSTIDFDPDYLLLLHFGIVILGNFKRGMGCGMEQASVFGHAIDRDRKEIQFALFVPLIGNQLIASNIYLLHLFFFGSCLLCLVHGRFIACWGKFQATSGRIGYY